MDKLMILLGSAGLFYYQGTICNKGICELGINMTLFVVSLAVCAAGWLMFYVRAVGRKVKE